MTAARDWLVLECPEDDPPLDRRWIAASVVSRADNEKVIAAGVPRRWIETGCFRRFGVEQGKIVLPINPVPNDEQAFATWVPGDLVYFDLEELERWSTVYGSPILNARALERAVHYSEPLLLYATPLSWMRHQRADDVACRGCCVLARGVDLLELFRGVPAVICETDGMGELLDRAFRRCLPRILVRSPVKVLA